MDYRFTVLTFAQPITTRTSGTETLAQSPWSNVSGTINMSGATLSTITLADDDDRFQSSRYIPDTNGQTLTTAFTFGNDAAPTPAGTGLAFYLGSIIRTPNGDGTFDEFLVMFPRTAQAGTFGTETGGRHAVLVMPVPRSDGTYPVFSLSKAYSFKGLYGIGRANDSVAYPPLATGAVPCFAAGTMIETPGGPRPVESLRPGDLVLTRDHGEQPLRWQGGTRVTSQGLDMQPNLRPILIRAGALGAGSPATDLMVSPQHRMLVRSRIAHRMFENSELLIAAKHLVGLPGIEIIVPPEGVTYHHVLFDRHEILLSNGAWSESLYTGLQALTAISDAARREIVALFPELAQGKAPAPARRLLNGREARQLAERQQRNIGKRSLVEAL